MPRWSTELQDHVKREIAPYKYPRAIEFVAQLPKTGTGKLQRFTLRQMAAGIGHGRGCGMMSQYTTSSLRTQGPITIGCGVLQSR